MEKKPPYGKWIFWIVIGIIALVALILSIR